MAIAVHVGLLLSALDCAGRAPLVRVRNDVNPYHWGVLGNNECRT